MQELQKLLDNAQERFQANLDKMNGSNVSDPEYMTLLNANTSLADRIEYLKGRIAQAKAIPEA